MKPDIDTLADLRHQWQPHTYGFNNASVKSYICTCGAIAYGEPLVPAMLCEKRVAAEILELKMVIARVGQAKYDRELGPMR